MAKRLRRVEQVERNGERVLAAARRVFLARGYAGASLDAIAEEAGFSKGVVYSQFESKADLFLALLDRRIDERAEQNERVVGELAGRRGLAAILQVAERLFHGEPEWALLVVEFRVHAARDAKLAERYRRAHARTLERLADALARVHGRAGIEPGLPPRTMAELVLAFGVGIELERINDPGALGDVDIGRVLSRALGFDAANGRLRKVRRKQR